VWDHARSPGQIRQDMVAPPTNHTGLVGHWQLDEGTGLVRSPLFSLFLPRVVWGGGSSGVRVY
jgi:hypothetical protein